MIYYYCPEHDVPSWGVGMLYYHVHFLSSNGIDACVLHNKPGFKISWLALNIPISYIEAGSTPKNQDIMVVPEFYAANKTVQNFRCRKILFVQNSFILLERIAPSQLNKLGYEAGFYYMPHLNKLLSNYFNRPLYETPPFIADYYYKDLSFLHERKKHIIIYPKTESRDYNVIEKLLEDNYPLKNIFSRILGKAGFDDSWKIVVMKKKSHQQVALAMKEAAFFINLNTHEAFNSSVPEAMAAGCINFTYDAFGPADFLKNQKNAFVFNNNHVFSLYEKLRHYVDNYDTVSIQTELKLMRLEAYHTAALFTTKLAEKAIVKVFIELG